MYYFISQFYNFLWLHLQLTINIANAWVVYVMYKTVYSLLLAEYVSEPNHH
jgi:hypothetical protein